MAHWNTQEIVGKIAEQFPSFTVNVVEPEEPHHFSDELYISIGDEDIHIVAFNDEYNRVENPKDGDYEFCSIMDGQDDQGGLNSDTPDMITVYHACKRIMSDMGFEVVRTYENYF